MLVRLRLRCFRYFSHQKAPSPEVHFTPRALKVLELSMREARQLGHNYLGTEHILLGLIHEGEGIAAKYLKNLGISLDVVREAVKETSDQGQQASFVDMPTTPGARNVFGLSLREGLQFGLCELGTEQILLGLVGESEDTATQVLVKLGADLNLVRQEVIHLIIEDIRYTPRETIPYTHRFVANSDTNQKIARASLGNAHRLKSQWISYSLVLVPLTVLLMSSVGNSSSLGSRVSWAVAVALLPTILFAVLAGAISYFQMVRGSRLRLFKGAVLESGFGEDEMVYRNPIESDRIAYTAVKSVTARGEFVFLQYHGLPIVLSYPRELFPDEAIDRILLAKR